ncbi:MAG: Rieske (2Fe-2S) protein [Bacteroidia bacterium]|nr:Rieske (2Fe-2S) protein [Bacteroidia bacterium]
MLNNPIVGSIELRNLQTLKTNQIKLFRINGRRIVVAKAEEGLFAFEDRCTHQGASLADGVVICGTVQCPWHGSQFNIKNGTVKPVRQERQLKRLS